MAPRRYAFVSTWRVGAPLDETWTFLTSPGQSWVDWWPSLETADVRRTPGLVGSAATCTWRSPVGYRLTFVLTLTGVEPGRLVVLAADGDLAGTSTVRFAPEPDGGTRLDIELRVSTAKAWMNAAGLVLGPVFRYGHHAVMRRGERGLRRGLAPSAAPAGGGAPGEPGRRTPGSSAMDDPGAGGDEPF